MEKAKETGTDQELMRSMKVSKAVAAMAIPSVISSLVTVVYNMADTFFVGQTGDALQVAAVSLTNPIFILLMAFANMFGMGGSAVASMAMGEGKPKKVKNTTAFITYASLCPPSYIFLAQIQKPMNTLKVTSITLPGALPLSSGLRQPAL